MIHYTCDMCGKDLLVDEDTRYVVKVEVYAAYDPMEISEDDLQEDREDEMRELMDRMEEMDQEELEDQVHKTYRFDLCPKCWERYSKDPLFRSASWQPRRFGTN